MDLEPGIYTNISWEGYDALPYCRASDLKTLRDYPQSLGMLKRSRPMDVGAAVHGYFAGNGNNRFIVCPHRRDKRSADYQQFCVDYPPGVWTHLTAKEGEEVEALTQALEGRPTAKQLLTAGDPEVTVIADIDGFRCKGRLDRLARKDGEALIVELKTTTTVQTDKLDSQIYRMGWHMQAAWYCRLARQLGLRPRMVWVVVQTNPPVTSAFVRCMEVGEDWLRLGDDDIKEPFKLWWQGFATGLWPCFKDGIELATVPEWLFRRMERLDDE